MARLHQILDRIVFYGLLTTIVVTAVPYGSAQLWWTALFECVVFVLAIVGILDLMITKDSLPTGASVALPLILMCVFLLFQSLPLFAAGNQVIPDLRVSISADPFSTQQLAIKLLALILAGVLLLRYANTESRLRAVVYVVIAVGLASALLGLLRQGSGGPGWFFPLPKPERGFAQFVNRNHFGFLMEMTFGLALGVAIFSERHRRLIFLVAAGILWLTLIVSNSRGAIFASLCQIVFALILVGPALLNFRDSSSEPSRARRILGGLPVKVLLVIGLVVIFAYGVRWVGGEVVVRNIELTSSAFSEQGGHEQHENVSRRDIWRATWELAKAHPLVGSGFGGYWIAITKHHDASGKLTPQEAHNDYLEALAGGGIVGVALILWFAMRFVKRAVRTLSAPNRWSRGVAFGALAGLFGAMMHSFVDFGLHVPANALLFTVLLVVAAPECVIYAAGEEVAHDDQRRLVSGSASNTQADHALV
jgi:O-antigen ligase